MQVIDIVICVPLLYGLLKGMRNGLLIEVISAVSYLIAIYTAVQLAVSVGVWMQARWGWEASTAQLMAFVGLLVVVVVGLYFLGNVLTQVINHTGLGLLNRAGGALFGALKMALIMSVLLHFIERYKLTTTLVAEEKQELSLLWKPLMQFSALAYPQMSEWYQEAKANWDEQQLQENQQ